jgi:hypothetical protein
MLQLISKILLSGDRVIKANDADDADAFLSPDAQPMLVRELGLGFVMEQLEYKIKLYT